MRLPRAQWVVVATCWIPAATAQAETVPASQLQGTPFVVHGPVDEVPRALLDQVGEHVAIQRQDGGTTFHVGGGAMLTARHVYRDLCVHYPGQGYFVEELFVGRKSLPERFELRMASDPMSYDGTSFLSQDFGTWNDWTLLERTGQGGSGLALRSAKTLQPGERLWLVGDRTGGSLRVSQGAFDQVQGVNGYIRETRVEAGFSGGAVLDADGRVVGVVVVAAAAGKHAVFVTSDAIVGQINDQRVAHPDLPRLSLGHTNPTSPGGGLVGGISPPEASAARLPARVIPAGSFGGLRLRDAHAPLRDGDLLTALDGSPLRSRAGLREALAGRAAGELVTLDLLRGVELKTATLTLAAGPNGSPRFGARVDAAPAGGVVVLDAMPGLPAHSAGLREGDVLVALDGERIDSLHAFVEQVRAFSPWQSTSVELLRGGTRETLSVRLD